MTLEEAIKHASKVKYQITKYSPVLVGYVLSPTDAEWLELVVGALQKQIPKRPHNIKTAPSDCYISYGDCPCCNADVFEYQHYCIDCGQKIDWGDTE